MALLWPDRVLEVTAANGPFATTSAVTGFQRFNAVDGIVVGDTFKGVIIAVDNNKLPSGDWATGLLTYSAVDQITLTTLEDSSNGGAAVTWTAGTKWVMACPTAADYENWQALVTAAITEATAAEVWAGTATGKFISPKIARDAKIPTVLTSAATITPNFNAGERFTLTLAHNATLANPLNAQVGDEGYIVITQDDPGSWPLAYEDQWIFPAGTPTLQTDPGDIDVLCYSVAATGVIICSMVQPVDTSYIDAGDASTLTDAEAYTDAAIAAIAGNGSGTPPNGVVSGLGLAYTGSGLVWSMSAGSANINGDLVSATAQTVTLATADATNPRLDTFYLDDTGTFGKITGTAATNPSLPTVDPTSQLYLGFALVPATATDLTSTITTEPVYTEGSEWTGTASGSGVTIGSANHPKTGAKSIEFTAVAANAFAKFVDGSPTAFNGASSTLFSIRSQGAWNSKRSINIQYFNASGVAVGAPVVFKEGSFGFVSSNSSSYQDIVIPETLFAVAAGVVRGELRFTVKGTGGTMGFYLDDIKVQTIAAGSGGTGGGGVSNGITQDQADARYLKLTGGTLTGDVNVPSSVYGAGWNGSNAAPTKNDVYDKIEAVVAGVPGTYTDEMAQDAIGAMVDGTIIYTDATPLLSRAALTGDVTASAGSNATTIANGAVSLAKQANMATASLIYRKTAGSGAPEVNTLATLKTDLGLTGTNSGDQTITLTSDVTGSGTGSFATTIANNAVTTAKINNAAVTLAKIANASANSKLLGAGASGSGAAYAEITLGTGLSMSGTTLNSSVGSGAFQTLTDGATVTLDASLGNNFIWTLTGSTHTLANFTNPSDGQQVNIIIVQDATGSRLWAVGTKIKFSGGAPTLSTAANAIDMMSCIYNLALDKWICGMQKGYA